MDNDISRLAAGQKALAQQADLAPHYRKMKMEPIVFIEANEFPWTEGEIIKYVSRWRNKGGVNDLRKAIDLINRLINKATINEQACKIAPSYNAILGAGRPL